MNNTKEYMGSFECIVEGGDLIVGMPNTIRLIYTVGKYGIDDGGAISFFRRGVTDWQAINTENEKALGYTTVTTTGDANVFVSESHGFRPYESCFKVSVKNGCLKEGDKVEVVMGDTSKGSLGILTQTIVEKEHLIFVAIDSIGGNAFKEINQHVYLNIKNGICSHFDIVLPSTVKKDETFDIRVRVLDDYGNRCEDFIGTLHIQNHDGIDIENNTIEFNEKDKGVKVFTGKIQKDGIFKLTGSIDDYKMSAQSNPCKTIKDNEYKLFWGDMHGQNAEASGIGSMDDVLTFSKEVAGLDFTGWQGNDFEVSDANWEAVKNAMKKYHNPGKFITFLGYEWSGITANGGDHNIYYLGDDEKIYRSSHWLPQDEGQFFKNGQTTDSSKNDRNPISELWKEFKGRKDVMAIPHVGGRFANFDYYNKDIISLVEMHSHHGIFEWFMEEAIKREMKVGFIATSDDHTARVGLSYPMGSVNTDFGATFDVKSGLTALYAKELTKEALWEAFKERRCYAATSSRIILNFQVNGFIMGKEINLSVLPEIDINVIGTAQIDKIEIYRGLDLCETIKSEYYLDDRKTKRIKISWSGVCTRYRKKSVIWNGSIRINKGKILSAENYSVDSLYDGIMSCTSQVVNFNSKTSGDEDGVILEIMPQNENECEIYFDSIQYTTKIALKDIINEDITINVGEVNRKIKISNEGYEIETEKEKHTQMKATYCDKDVKEGLNIYRTKVTQKDGNIVWSSPVFVNYKR